MAETYRNPVFDHAFPDPFVLKHRGEYWGYCTGFTADGRCFGIMRSRNLVDWEAVGAALEPIPGSWPCYWAPEVTYANGRFYLYYSVGDEERMEIRVAIAEQPQGPFVDSGRRLTTEPFAIDPHLFRDVDRSWHMFYATDYLEHTHIGTGTAHARMRSLLELAEPGQPVTRARYDWQVYDPARVSKGGVRWHTIEGPFVLRHKGRYYQMFSGGNWQNPTYGVSYAVSERLDRADEWPQVADGQTVLPVLRTIPGAVLGPGHNSVVRGPDNRQLYCVYHVWPPGSDARVLAIDPLDWSGERLLVLGPSTSSRPAPLRPTLADSFEEPLVGTPGPLWSVSGGDWAACSGEAVQRASHGTAAAALRVDVRSYLAEVTLRSLAGAGSLGLRLGEQLEALIVADRRRLLLRAAAGGAWREEAIELSDDFEPRAWHLLRVEADGPRLRVALDDLEATWATDAFAGGAPALLTHGGAAAFSAFELTVGYEELFDAEGDELEARGWRLATGSWHVAGGELRQSDSSGSALALRGPPLEDYELVVSARLAAGGEGARYGVGPALDEQGVGPLLTVEEAEGRWVLAWRHWGPATVFELPERFDPVGHQQLRLRKRGDRLTIAWEGDELGEVAAPPGPAHIGLFCERAAAAFDLLRVTAIAG